MTYNRIRTRTALLAGCSAFAITGLASPSLAQGDEIIVSAQKREENIQDVPLAISAFSGEFTRERNLDDVKDLVLYTPGVTGNSKDSFIDAISIRGIITNDFGVGGDPSVPFFKNGLYQGRNGAVVTSLYDLERAEVLRGPQGFLFGRNAIGGAISVHTKRPELDAFGGYAELDVGGRGRVASEAAINVPVSDHFGVRLAGFTLKEDGYVDNFFFPTADPLVEPNNGGGRFSALLDGERFDAFVVLEYERRRQSGTVYRATSLGESFEALQDLFGVSVRGDGRDIDSDLGLGEADDSEIFSLGVELSYDLGGATLTSLTGYKDHNYFYAEDFDGTPLGINDYSQDQEGEYFEQELRLVSNSDGPFNWYAGVSYFDENIDVLFAQRGDEEVMCAYYLTYYGFSNCTDYLAYYGYVFTPNPNGLLERNAVRGRYHGWAGYVDLTYEVNPQFDIGVGVRYTRETKEFGLNALPVDSDLGPFFALGFTTTDFLVDEQSWDAFTPRVIARWRPADDWMLFASATRGFKAGGFGSFTIEQDDLPFTEDGLDLMPGDATPDSFDPEKAWSYEVGTKGVLFGGGARFDANVYYFDYKDLQVTVPGQGGGIVVDNVGEVTGWGVEGSLQTQLGPRFELLLAGAYADTEVMSAEALCDGTLDCEGASLPQVPKFSGSAVLAFNAPIGPGSAIAIAEVFGQSETFGGLRRLPEAVNGGYTDLSFRFGYEADAGWSLIGYVENVTNEIYYDGVAEGDGIIPAHYFGPSRPRTWGVRMTYDFGG